MNNANQPLNVATGINVDTATDINNEMNAKSCPDQLMHYPIVHTQPIQWGEMDAFNHLNNVIYYRYAETARIAYLQALGMFDGSMVTMLAQSSCQYLRPVTFPDTLLLGVRCQRLGNTSIVIEYSYYSCAQQAIVANSEAVIVRLDSLGEQKLPWTEEERARLLALEKKVGHSPKV